MLTGSSVYHIRCGSGLAVLAPMGEEMDCIGRTYLTLCLHFRCVYLHRHDRSSSRLIVALTRKSLLYSLWYLMFKPSLSFPDIPTEIVSSTISVSEIGLSGL